MKYVRRYGSSLALIDVLVPIDVEDGENGLILGAQSNRQWALVSNERMSVAQSAIDEVTGIKTLSDSPLKGENIYNLAGQRVGKSPKGINIIRYSDGTSKKVLIK